MTLNRLKLGRAVTFMKYFSGFKFAKFCRAGGK